MTLPGQDRAQERALAHAHLLSSDPAMRELAERQGPIDPYERVHRVPVEPGDLFEGLAFHIVGQSISEAAAIAVYERVRVLVGGAVSAEALTGASIKALHEAGLSGSKARTLFGLATSITAGDLDLDLEVLVGESDQEIESKLTRLPGIGPWTAHIFLLYELRRPDAMPAEEIGIRKAVGLLDACAQPPSADAVLRRAEIWRPYRSYAAGHLWRSLRG